MRFFNANKDKLERQGVDVDEWNRAGIEKKGDPPMKKPVKWEQGVAAGIKKAGHKGIFAAAARRAGKTTIEYANEHEHDKGVLGSRSRLALTFMRSKKK